MQQHQSCDLNRFKRLLQHGMFLGFGLCCSLSIAQTMTPMLDLNRLKSNRHMESNIPSVLQTSGGSELQNAEPQDFKNRLQQRRISEYASFDKALFNRAFDVGLGFSYGSSDEMFAQRTAASNVFVSTGINAKLGLNISLDSARIKSYDQIDATPQFLGQERLNQQSLGLNVLLLPESVNFPQLVFAATGGRGKQGIRRNSRSYSLSTSRTLESASLFTSFDFSKTKSEVGSDSFQRSLSASYFLTINHRLAAGLGYSISKPSEGLSVPSASASLVYRAWPDWVLRFSAQQSDGAISERTFGVDVTRTFNP